jgi:hypothetical protein
MKKLNFEQYMECLSFLDTPLKLWDYLKEDTDPDINTMNDDEASEMIKLMLDYMNQQITPTQKICSEISIVFGIPYNQVLELPKEVGVYLAALLLAKNKEKELQSKPKSIGEQINDAKNKIDTQNTGGINPQQLAAIFQALQGNKG